MTNYEDLIQDVLGAHAIIGCPVEVAIDAIRKSVIELCERSHIMKQVYNIDLQAKVNDYVLETDGCTVIKAIDKVAVQGFEYRAGWPYGSYNYGSTYTYNNGVLVLTTTPQIDVEAGLQVVVTVKPAQQSCEFSSDLYEDWLETIANGAAARLFAMPKTDWYNLQAAQMCKIEFARGLNRARNTTSSGKTRSMTRIKPRYF